jgi:hypothetical protein
MIRDDAKWIRAANAWLKAHEAYEKAQLTLAKKRLALTRLAADTSASGAGVSVARYFRAGTIDYGKIEVLRDVPLDQYRRAGSWEYRLTKD